MFSLFLLNIYIESSGYFMREQCIDTDWKYENRVQKKKKKKIKKYNEYMYLWIRLKRTSLLE